jgi:hypothetical protein
VVQQRGDVVDRGRHPRRQLGHHVEHLAAKVGGRDPVEVGGQRVVPRASLVAAAHQCGHPGRGQPGARQHRPALGDLALAPGVVRRCREPRRVDVVVAGEQPSRAGELDDERGGGLIDVQQPGCSGEVAHPEPPAAQLAGRRHGPGVEQVGDQTHDLEGVLTRGAVDERGLARGAGGDVDDRRRRLGLLEEAPVAQHEGDLPRQLHGGRVDGLEQAVGQHPVDGRARGRRADVALGVGHGAPGRAPREAVEQLAGLLGCLGEEASHPLRVVGVADGAGGVGCGRQTAGEGAEALPHGAHEVQLVIVPPEQGALLQAYEGRVDVVGRRAGQRRRDGCAGRRVGQRGEHLGHLQGPAVEGVESPRHRRRRGGAHGELGQVVGHRVHQVGPQPQQRRQGSVVPRAQVVGQRPRQGAHQTDGSRPRDHGHPGRGDGPDRRVAGCCPNPLPPPVGWSWGSTST